MNMLGQWASMTDPERHLFAIKCAQGVIKYLESSRADLKERVKELLGGRMTTWPDGQLRLLNMAKADAAKEACTSKTRSIPLDVFLSEAWLHARDATDSTDAFCGFVVARLVALHGPGGRIDGSNHVLQSYLKKEILSYENLRTHSDLVPGANLHFEEKAKHMRQLIPGMFFNAKAVGEDCGDDNPYCLLCHSMKMYVVFRLRNGDDVAFAYKMAKSSGEATWVRGLAGDEETGDLNVLWNFIWPLTRASSVGGLDKIPVMATVTTEPTYGVTRGPRNFGKWKTYETPSLKDAVDALQRYTRG